MDMDIPIGTDWGTCVPHFCSDRRRPRGREWCTVRRRPWLGLGLRLVQAVLDAHSYICAHWGCSSSSTQILRACMVRLMPRRILMASTNCGCIPEDADPAWEAELPGELAVEPLPTLGGVWTWTW